MFTDKHKFILSNIFISLFLGHILNEWEIPFINGSNVDGIGVNCWEFVK